MEHSSLSIILRTVCGCERILEIPFRSQPPTFAVPYTRGSQHHIYPGDGETCMSGYPPSWDRRVFERTDHTGTYGYPVYLEVLKEKDGQLKRD